MAYLIGTDEAGYGPNLGPLVVSASVWEVPDGLSGQGLYGVLASVVADRPEQPLCHGPTRVAIADSKRLYQSGKGLRHLERGLLAALALLDRRPRCCRGLWEALAPGASAQQASIPWYAGYDAAVPVCDDPAAVDQAAARLQTGLAGAGVRLVELRSRAVFEGPFNRLLQQHGTKGEALSHVTLGLVAELCRKLGAGPICVLCDKHGGRNRYARLLAEHFPGSRFEVCSEGRQQSLYRFGPPDRRVEVRFQAKGESHLPTALASMASKYLRELAMEALNAFWSQRVDGLGRTAGYPQDAKRFKAQIAAVQTQLGIEDRWLWRMK